MERILDLQAGSSRELNKPAPGMWRFPRNPDLCCIYRVPNCLRQVNPEAYTPQLVLIGPLHHSLKSQALMSRGDITNTKSMGYLNMEELKKVYLVEFARRVEGKKTIDGFRTIIEEDEDIIRASYSESTAWISSPEFVDMILHDSVFLLEFFLRYTLWFESFLSGQDLLGFVNGSSPAPAAMLQAPQVGGMALTVPNPDYSEWFRADQIVRAWLLGSLSEEILAEVTGTTTAKELWLALAKHFNKVSSSRLFELQSKLQTSEKLDRSMSEYLRDIKNVCDQLASIGNPVSEKMKIFAALKGLGREYEPIKVSIEGMIDLSPGPTFDDVASRLKTFADRLTSYNVSTEASPHLAFYTNYSGRGKGNSYGRSGNTQGRGGYYSTKGRGFPQQITSGSSSSGTYNTENKVVCQICGKPGHPALKCWHRFNNSYQYEELPAALTAMRITDVTDHNGSEWVGDSGATAHITNSHHNLQQSQPYGGSDTVMVGNGDFLPITHTGSATLPASSGILPLNDVLVCPNIGKSLLSISKLTMDYPCSVNFDCDYIRVTDKATKQLLAQGNNHNGLYILGDSPVHAFYSSRQQSASEDVWHMRLGHPNHQVLQCLQKNKDVIINKSSKGICEACQFGKSSRLPFSSSCSTTSRPLEKIHCDLWGPAPLKSVQGFCYYVIFVDNYSLFCWFYPLKFKSDFLSIFTTFQALVENQFQTKIGTFQCDGGGEFTSAKFLNHLQQHGIQQYMSCPYTPQQNGLAERKHRHLIELGLSMMCHSRMPMKYWVEGFYTANFLINLLPSSVLQDNKSPYEVLIGHKPDYTSLRVFGCSCYPTLRDYARNKFDPRSLKCVFLGYNEKYKGYRCLLLSTGRVYISRHVVFDEQDFPFHRLSPSPQSLSTPLLSAWQKGFHEMSTNNTEQQAQEQETLPERQSTIISEDIIAPISLPTTITTLPTVSNAESSGCTAGIDPDPIGNSSQSSLHGMDSVVSPTSSSSQFLSNMDSDQSTAVLESTELPPSPVRQSQGHHMVTRSQVGIRKPNPRYALLTSRVSYPEPKTVTTALKDAGWNKAMHEEYENCQEAETWSLIPYTPDMHVLGCKWVFRTKLNADGSLDKLKARIVAKGFDQEEGIDYLETYSPVVRTATVRSILHVATIMGWEIKQMDVKNAFLHGDLTETVYMTQPAGFVDPAKPDHVCHLHKSLYGLKQAPRAWFDKFSTYLLEFGFTCSMSDPSLFVYTKGKDIIMLLLYVDDMAITGNNSDTLATLLLELNKRFRMKDMGKLNYFLGIQAQFHSGGLFLSQQKYAEDLLAVAGMLDCAPMPTPLPLQLNKVPNQEDKFENPTYFRSLAGKLQYLTLTRPDIQYAVNFVCQKMHMPTVSDFHLLKRIIRYIKGTITMGISFNKDTDCTLRAYSDSDYAGCQTTSRSTGGFCTFLGNNIISWQSQKQPTVAKSSTEAEYRALSEAASEITWLCKILKELGIPLHQPPELYCDNLSSVYLTANPAFHKRSKHFANHYHYVREQVALGTLRVSHIPSHLQLADIFTKSLPLAAFTSLRFKLGVDVPPTPSLRGTIKGENQDLKNSTEKDEVQLPKGKVNLIELSDKRDCSASDITPNGVVKPNEPKQKPKPNNMIWRPKTKCEPIQDQRLSAKQQDKDGELVTKEASRKLPKSKSNTSCPSQDLILTNRFKCLEDEDQILEYTVDGDLILLENQLPYFILEKLFDQLIPTLIPMQTFSELTITHFGLRNGFGNNSKFRHFTDLLRCVRVKKVPDHDLGKYEPMYEMYSADKLHTGGVKFKAIDDLLSVEVKFKNGVLYIPCFVAEDQTEMKIRNIMALEQCHYLLNAHVCNYIMFLDFLIDTEKDVDLLVEKGIITNWLGHHRAVEKMVNKLSVGVILCDSSYSDIARQVRKQYNNKWNKSYAVLRRVYCSDLWTGTATVAATCLLLMTLIQTVSSVIQITKK
ncbi:GAG-pre-integrase domain [Arabidopsis suecica]|uniref:GAG-pre-integrase domain n=1 Tax=Arabidopsis suecica TaxID=45249 RepID=A0A8T2BQ94_ARASU|nr:GAG-pre-integrase domain [Arabidopsis suecica]